MREEIRKLEGVTREQLIRLLTGVAQFHQEFGKDRRCDPDGPNPKGKLLLVETPEGRQFALENIMSPVRFEVIEVEGNCIVFDEYFTYKMVVIKLVPNSDPLNAYGNQVGVGCRTHGSFDLLPLMYNVIDRALGVVPEIEVRRAYFEPYGKE
jgi:hypothetical protein